MQKSVKAFVVTADMGYGHQRGVHPLIDIAEGGIITVGQNDNSNADEIKLWKQLLDGYEFFSRARSIPIIGKYLFGILDVMLHIPSYYPIRDLSDSTMQVETLQKFIKNGLCKGMMNKISNNNLPLVTSFYAPAIAADVKGYNNIYCIICDADINRVWVAKHPWDSRVNYFASCGKAAQRLKAYGVPEERIFLTGFPLDKKLLGDENLSVLKKDLGQRLLNLDPGGRFMHLYGKSVEHFLGMENLLTKKRDKLTITYAVGGAGALKEIGGKIAKSLKLKLHTGKVKLYLVAGIRQEVNKYFEQIKESLSCKDDSIEIIYDTDKYKYFEKFNVAIRNTDILWTKPSELSFYCGLGLPIILAPAIGSQEVFNKKWLFEINVGIKQENPDFTDQWLFDMLNSGRLAESAWNGFLKSRKLGVYKIEEVLKTGKLNVNESYVFR
ncbi:MAG TPA: hypothetical protein PL041_02785 [Melioribacteraceae bacterium]|nr:hypothetical protein [Melioribacteraceae bacterium]